MQFKIFKNGKDTRIRIEAPTQTDALDTLYDNLSLRNSSYTIDAISGKTLLQIELGFEDTVKNVDAWEAIEEKI
jgi:hypothetical protein